MSSDEWLLIFPFSIRCQKGTLVLHLQVSKQYIRGRGGGKTLKKTEHILTLSYSTDIYFYDFAFEFVSLYLMINTQCKRQMLQGNIFRFPRKIKNQNLHSAAKESQKYDNLVHVKGCQEWRKEMKKYKYLFAKTHKDGQTLGYDAVSDVVESDGYWRSDFQTGSRV